jgi:hypothetical protein
VDYRGFEPHPRSCEANAVLIAYRIEVGSVMPLQWEDTVGHGVDHPLKPKQHGRKGAIAFAPACADDFFPY